MGSVTATLRKSGEPLCIGVLLMGHHSLLRQEQWRDNNEQKECCGDSHGFYLLRIDEYVSTEYRRWAAEEEGVQIEAIGRCASRSGAAWLPH